MGGLVEQVQRLRSLGFLVRPIPLPNSQIGGLHLSRFATDDEFLDAVVITAERLTIATRFPNQFDARSPLESPGANWSRVGAVDVVVNEFLQKHYRDDSESTQSRFRHHLE